MEWGNLLPGLLRNFCVVALDEDHSSETVCLNANKMPCFACQPKAAEMELQKHQVCVLRSADQRSYILCCEKVGPYQPREFHGNKVSGIAVLRVGPSEMPAAK